MNRTDVTLPKPKPVTLDPRKSALLVLDIGQRWGTDPKLPCHQLAQKMTPFLRRAREVGMLIIFTVAAYDRGTPNGRVYDILERRPCEAVIFPDSFDKFTGGELGTLLRIYEVDTLVITGYRSNVAVLYTATMAARNFSYRVVIPVDGIVTLKDYEQEYTLYQFTSFQPKISERFLFTTLDGIHCTTNHK